MTKTEMMTLPFDPNWSDGREGFEWCRFDAVIDKHIHLRAEVTWDDNDGQDFHSPMLRLETNYIVNHEWKTRDQIVIHLTDDEARYIVSKPPAMLRKKYANVICRLAGSEWFVL